MKLHTYISATLTAAALFLVGCSKSESSVDAAPVEKAFAAADAPLKEAATKVVDAVKKSDYPAALGELQKLAANVKLTDEQKKAVSDVIAQVQKAIADMGAKASGEANKAIGDAQKALGK